MLNSHTNSVRDQPYTVQLEHFHIDATQRTLQRGFSARKPRAARFKKAKVKTLSQKNERIRVLYGKEHENHTIENFWQYVHFTDEAHFDPDQTYQERVLREEGTRYESENMQKMPDMKGVKLHLAASISWHHKGPLTFYNDEHDAPEIQVHKPRKPHKSKYETEHDHRQRIAEWEASLPHDLEIKSKGNSMTQAYFTERLLPGYMTEIHECRVFHDRFCIFQEDNDPSHGTRSTDNIVRRIKAASWIETLNHPPQSPDLNPTEGVWNILKQRVRRRRCSNVRELKRVILDEWNKISIDETGPN